MKALLEGIPTTWAHDAIIYDEKPLTCKAAWNQRKRWAQGHFDVANRYIPKMLYKGIKERNIVILDGIVNLFQPYFLLLSTFFVLSTYVYMFIPFYTNVLFAILPVQVWTLVGVGQYIFPVVVLWKIKASSKSWYYLLFYPFFIYTWVSITFLVFIYRNDHVWSHTAHTRSIAFDDVLIPENAELRPKQVMFQKGVK